MSQGMLRGSVFRKWLFLILVGTLALHRPIVQGATILAESQETGTGVRVVPYPERAGLNIRHAAFVSQPTALGFDASMISATNSVMPAITPAMAILDPSSSPENTSTVRLALDRDAALQSTVPSEASPTGIIHWFAFERRLALDEAPQVARAAPSAVPRIQPLVNSSPIPLLPAARSALALGVAAGVLVLVKRGRRAFR
jgi:hypothetical protein